MFMPLHGSELLNDVTAFIPGVLINKYGYSVDSFSAIDACSESSSRFVSLCDWSSPMGY